MKVRFIRAPAAAPSSARAELGAARAREDVGGPGLYPTLGGKVLQFDGREGWSPLALGAWRSGVEGQGELAGELALGRELVVALSADVARDRTDRRAWLYEVERLTATFRERRARRLRWRAHVRAQANPEAARWHYARATGELERFARARDCGQSARLVRAHCRACGVVHELIPGCGAVLVCVACRKRAMRRAQARFLRARSERVRRIGRRMRGHGAYSDKLVTFTVPHVGTAAERIEWLRRAQERFGRWWADHMPRDIAGKKPGLVWQQTSHEARGGHWRIARPEERLGYAWLRSIEWKQSADGEGHPHAHVWALCPYLPQRELTRAWRRALAASDPPVAGYVDASHEVPSEPGSSWPIPIRVDIRRIRSAKEAAAEVIKYATKDLEHESRDGERTGKLVEPSVYATVYQLFCGRRRIQACRGFYACLADSMPCRDCGCADARIVRLVLRPPEPTLVAVRGPP